MGSCGVLDGGTLDLGLAYSGESSIPVNFACVLAAPIYFDATQWELLKRVNRWKTDGDFYKIMLGNKYNPEDLQTGIDNISPSSMVNENSPPTLIGYGKKDHCVPQTQKDYLINALENYNVSYDFIDFPRSNHGLYLLNFRFLTGRPTPLTHKNRCRDLSTTTPNCRCIPS